MARELSVLDNRVRTSITEQVRPATVSWPLAETCKFVVNSGRPVRPSESGLDDLPRTSHPRSLPSKAGHVDAAYK